MDETWTHDDATGEAIVEVDDATGERHRIRVPWEHRATSLGWGKRRRARFNHPRHGSTHAVIVSEGRAGITARDETGELHMLPAGSFETVEWPSEAAPRPMAKAAREGQVWIAPHMREGHPVAGHWRKVEPGVEFAAPEWAGGSAHLEAVEDGEAVVEHQHGRARMPLASVPHYLHDLNEVLPHPATSGDPAIDGVLRGEGARVGKGNDGIVYRAPTGEAVKVSTTTPYQPHNLGHRTPEEAIGHLHNELQAHQALAGLPNIPTVRGTEHDGRFYVVKPWAPETPKLTRAELDSVAATIEGMHARGWSLNDSVQIGRSADGRTWLNDLGQAHDGATPAEMGRDLEHLDELFRSQGESRKLKGPELAKELSTLEFLLERGPSGLPTRAGRERSMLAKWSQLHESRTSELVKEEGAAYRTKDPAKHEAAEEATTAHLHRGDEIRKKWASVLSDLSKAEKEHADPPPGSRWITVHPNGPGSEGNVILIMPAGDGTHRVIGGAGGSMNHLRLRDVKSEDKLRDEAKQRRKDKATTERERRKLLTPEERESEKSEKEAKKKTQQDAEREVIKVVRKKWGGIDADLTDEDTEGMSPAAAEKLKDRHHRKQFSQAMRARKDIAKKLARERVEQIEDQAAVDATIEDDPDLWATAHEMGQRELDEIEAEAESRRATRTPRESRARHEEKASDASDTAAGELEKTDREKATGELEKAGGRATERKIVGETASAESRRRSAESVDDALILHDAAEGKGPSDDPVRAGIEHQVITKALRAAGIDLSAPPDQVKEALRNEARIAHQQAQLHELKAQKFEELERVGKGDQAMKSLVKTDIMRGLTEEVRDATKRLGLREDAKTPLKQAEIAELLDVLGSFDKLKKAKDGLDQVVQEAEPPTHDASRRAFYFAMSEPPQHVVEGVEELVKRELAQRIVGLADTKSSAHVKAVSDGHYAKIADISLAVSKQNHVDRATVDAVGLKNAGILLRHALESQGHEADDLHDALIGHHVREQGKITADALRMADAYVPNLEQTVEDAGGVEHALKRLDASEADIDDAQRAIGGALGQMEATATLAQTMRGKMPEHLTIELKDKGTAQLSSHFTWLASIGLEKGQYQVDLDAKEIRIPREHWGKLIRSEDQKTVQARQLASDIKRGDHDEKGWMPKGMISRSSTSFTDPPKTAPRYHQSLNLRADDMHTELADHIGSRLADGERPSDIAVDLLSPNVAGKHPDPGKFSDHVREFFPTHAEEDKPKLEENRKIRAQKWDLGKQYKAATDAGDSEKVAALAKQISELPDEHQVQAKRDVDFESHYQELAAGFLRRHHPDASPVHAQTLYQPGVDEKDVRESVFRALASNPEHVAAFTPIGQLKPDHRRALQDYFYRRAGIGDTRDWSSEFKEELETGYDNKETGKFVEPLIRRVAESGDNQSKAFEAMGGGALFGGGGAPKKKIDAVTKENFAELYPEEAKELAYRYPREGRELHAQAMGARPAEPTEPSKLPDHVTKAIETIRERKPHLGAAELAKAAAEHLGRERASAELKLDPAKLDERDSEGKLTTAAKLLQAKLENRGKDLAERGVDPREVQRVYGGKIHDAQTEAFEQHAKRNETPWSSFVDLHGGTANAYQALQGEMKGEFAKNLSSHYSKVTGKTVQTGIAEVHNANVHAAAIGSPRERKAFAEVRRKEILAAREREETGRYKGTGEGSAIAKFNEQKEQEKATDQAQGGMFGLMSPKPRPPASDGGLFGAGPPKPGKLEVAGPGEKRDPKKGERMALGDRVENEVTSLVGGNLGQNMDPRQKVRLFAGADMDGRRIHQQRVIKMLRQNGGRLGAWLGTGSGKTPTSIGAFTDLHGSGDTTHGLFLVPTAVQNQFGEEMQSFTEPGKYRFETGDGKGHAQRVGMLRDKNTHMRVMTHQSAAQTVLRMAAEHHGIAPEAMLERMRGMKDGERAQALREAGELDISRDDARAECVSVILG